MKTIVAVLLASLLSSCALVDAYRMAKFDNYEYALVNRINTMSVFAVEKCGTEHIYVSVDEVHFAAAELKSYSVDIPRNQETVKMTTELYDITKTLKERYASPDEVSQKYCELKFNNIKQATDTMKKIIGAKPR